MTIPGQWTLTLLAVLALAAGAVWAQPVSPVGYTDVLQREVRGTLRLTGSVESRRASVVAGEVEGLVVSIGVREGDRVDKGAPLARLRSTNVKLDLRAAEGRLKESRARLELATSTLDRARRLFENGIVSQEELDDAHSEFTAWQGRLDQTAAEIARLEADRDRTVIRAPFAGAVVARRTEVGQWLDVGGPVVDMVSMEELEVKVEVPERYYRDLEPGSAATVRFEALPGHEVEARIDGIVPSADPQARTFPVRVGIRNEGRAIGVGMLAEVLLPVGERQLALVVPKDAVVRQGTREIVYRINGDDTVEPVLVESGQGVGVWIVVSGPLEAGERVVTRGNERLRPGQAVEGSSKEYALP